MLLLLPVLLAWVLVHRFASSASTASLVVAAMAATAPEYRSRSVRRLVTPWIDLGHRMAIQRSPKENTLSAVNFIKSPWNVLVIAPQSLAP